MLIQILRVHKHWILAIICHPKGVLDELPPDHLHVATVYSCTDSSRAGVATISRFIGNGADIRPRIPLLLAEGSGGTPADEVARAELNAMKPPPRKKKKPVRKKDAGGMELLTPEEEEEIVVQPPPQWTMPRSSVIVTKQVILSKPCDI